jgi:hypothetical protein
MLQSIYQLRSFVLAERELVFRKLSQLILGDSPTKDQTADLLFTPNHQYKDFFTITFKGKQIGYVFPIVFSQRNQYYFNPFII